MTGRRARESIRGRVVSPRSRRESASTSLRAISTSLEFQDRMLRFGRTVVTMISIDVDFIRLVRTWRRVVVSSRSGLSVRTEEDRDQSNKQPCRKPNGEYDAIVFKGDTQSQRRGRKEKQLPMTGLNKPRISHRGQPCRRSKSRITVQVATETAVDHANRLVSRVSARL